MTFQLPPVVPSPISGHPSPLQRTIPAQRLVTAYAERFGYDATRWFEAIDAVGLYACSTGYRFYYPFSLAGDESLYRQLETFEWNYQPDKWEHNVALRSIGSDASVLDVGCGEGHFLVKAARKGAIASGIELNRQAADVARSKGIRVHEELIGAHVTRDGYDMVTSFQVLEHVTDPLGFLRDCVRVLKPGGALIVGVPNDDSFLRLDDEAVLNQPPHHMGLWNRASLEAVAPLIGVSVRAFEIEPLDVSIHWYQGVMEKTYLTPWQSRIFHRSGIAKAFAKFLEGESKTIAGHSILVIYDKPGAAA